MTNRKIWPTFSSGWLIEDVEMDGSFYWTGVRAPLIL